MCRRRIKRAGQVILEATIVVVCLAVISIAAMRLFSNMNLNMLKRLDVYRQTRLDAVNDAINRPQRLPGIILPIWRGETRAVSDPATFLDYFPDNASIIPGEKG